MDKGQRRRVQGLAWKTRHGGARGRVQAGSGAARAAIDRIADQGVAEMRHMDPDLVRAPGLQPAGDQRRPAPERLFQPQPRHGGFAARHHGHALAVGPVPADGGLDPQGAAGLEGDPGAPGKPRVAAIGHAMADGGIAAVDLMGGELRGQAAMRDIGPGHDQQPRSVLVDPMHDARPGRAAHPRQNPAGVMQKRIDKRARPGAGGGMDDHAGGLVDDDQIGILMHHLERQGLGRGDRRGSGRQRDRPDLARRRRRRGIGHRHAAATHRAFGDEPGDPRARQAGCLWHRARQRLIEAPGRIRGQRHGQGIGGVDHGQRTERR
jgi:hypothetical protein